VLSDLGEEGQILKRWRRRRIVRRVDDHREVIPFLLTEARASISIVQVAVITLFKFIHHAIPARSKGGLKRWDQKSGSRSRQEKEK
jgi:hypothetical protein